MTWRPANQEAPLPKEVIATPSAPAALGPYSPAVESNGFVFVSGQVAITSTGERPDSVVEQATVVLDNIAAILGDAGLSMRDVVKTTIYLADIGDFADVNGIYAEYFAVEPPARSTFQVGALPGGYLIEIDVVAAR